MGLDTAVAREVAWLSTTGDSLPSLPASAGGPWTVIDAYTQAAATRTQATAIYVTLGPSQNLRVANQRTRLRFQFRLELRWPVVITTPGTSTSIAAAAQQAFDTATELLRQRVAGPLGDKSHGGRFLSAAEAQRGQPGIDIQPEPADQAIKASKELRKLVVYWADDYEVSN
ncbi:MAG TPA: hypothetical protein VGS06_11685 [Streptosporangiaceae bacterium]|nr:hypothetical protein [Streptosporangiaceae bacterium]